MSKYIYIYDLEVFKHDWLLVARQPGGEDYVVIHNNNHEVKEFMQTKDLLLGGFNSKFYDDAILNAIVHGADNDTVKKLNDFIIVEKGMWWEFPFLNFKKKDFMSFDLRDDLPVNLSLKAIEGNMGGSIVETGVPFDIDRPLTPDEVVKTIRYCKTDVDKTIDLYHKRKSYLDSKRAVGKLKGLSEDYAMTLTNAKLTAEFLDAKMVNRTDEKEYPIPDTLQIGKYKEVLEFFQDPVPTMIKYWEDRKSKAKTERSKQSAQKKINYLLDTEDIYECKLTTTVAGTKHVYGWGGIHGAKPKYRAHADEKYNIVLIDVGSYYPSMMLEYDYISRNIPSKKGFADIYHRRMNAKATGDEFVSGSLKLVLNTTYGAMKNRYNNLYDPRNANAICVGGQLLLTDLIDKIEAIKDITVIQSNTDGVTIKYPRADENRLHQIVGEWEARTRLNMEYTEIKVIAQKDVNNYVMRMGEVYTMVDGVKHIEKPDNDYVHAIGAYAKQHAGGTFEGNSEVAVHRALVRYLMFGEPIEDTIHNENDVSMFQNIAKTGATYSGTFHEVNGSRVDVQNVNRVYATTNKAYGTIKKMKTNGRADKIAGLPDNAIIDNDATMTIEQIDKLFYIELAKSRLVDYVGKKNANIKQEDHVNMTTKPKDKKEVELKQLTIYEKINAIRKEFHEAGTKKTGVNRYAEYTYFSLEDIIPRLRELNEKYNLTALFDFRPELATLTIIDNDALSFAAAAPFEVNPNMLQVSFTSPMATQAMPKGTEVQQVGAVHTYLRRYLYMLYLDLVEVDEVEETAGQPDKPTKAADKPKGKTTVKTTATKKSNVPATPKQREAAKDNVIDKDGEASETQIKSIKNGLKKLRDKDAGHEDFIKKVALKIREGIDKTQAEKLLLSIAEKVKA